MNPCEQKHMCYKISPQRYVGGDSPCFIVAEIGQNHQGDMDIAMNMIKSAAQAKCDAVKFQKSYLNCKFNNKALSRQYCGPDSFGSTYGEHKKHLDLSDEQFHLLQRYATNEGVIFSASAMDKKSVDFLVHLNVPFIKIGSGDIDNFPLIEYAAQKNQAVVLSTGMHDLQIVETAYSIASEQNDKIGLLHCLSAYPAPPEDIHLNIIKKYQKVFPKAVIGYSGHEIGISISIAAVSMGAKILERHFTLDKTMKGNDHKCSLEPQELEKLIEQIRLVELALGSCNKLRRSSELPCYEKLGKSIVASEYLKQGTILKQELIDIKVAEPKGIAAYEFYKILGKIVCRDIDQDETLQFSDLQ